MTKKVFNRFDPFMPIKIDESPRISLNISENSRNDFFEEFNVSALSEELKFRTPNIKKGFSILITKKSIGDENGLGEKLLENFIYSLSDSFELPQYLIFMNEAVTLLAGGNLEDSLFKLKKYGVKNLVSIESLDHFNYKINSKSIIQATSGDITEKILFSKKLISL